MTPVNVRWICWMLAGPMLFRNFFLPYAVLLYVRRVSSINYHGVECSLHVLCYVLRILAENNSDPHILNDNGCASLEEQVTGPRNFPARKLWKRLIYGFDFEYFMIESHGFHFFSFSWILFHARFPVPSYGHISVEKWISDIKSVEDRFPDKIKSY